MPWHIASTFLAIIVNLVASKQVDKLTSQAHGYTKFTLNLVNILPTDRRDLKCEHSVNIHNLSKPMLIPCLLFLSPCYSVASCKYKHIVI